MASISGKNTKPELVVRRLAESGLAGGGDMGKSNTASDKPRKPPAAVLGIREIIEIRLTESVIPILRVVSAGPTRVL